MVRIVLTTIVLLCYGLMIVQAQGVNDFSHLEYAKIIKSNEKKIEKNPLDTLARYDLAIAYSKTGQTDKSLEQYLELISMGYEDFQPEDWNNIGQYSLANGKMKLASLSFEKLEAFNPTYRNRRMPSAGMYYEAKNLSEYNSRFNEFCPVKFEDKIVITSDRPASVYDLNKTSWTETPYLSLFTVDTLQSTPVKPFGNKLNQTGHTGPAVFANQENIAFYTHSYLSDRKGLNTARIVMSTRDKDKWKEHTSLNLGNDKDYSFAHPVFLEKLNMLIFSSDQPDGFGDMDLYFSILTGDTWSKPQNLGETINTSFNEVFPSIDPFDRNSIYFSSNGYLGYGGLDLYKTTFENGNWTTPELLPKAINSNYDDFGILFTDAENGIVSSNRPGGKGRDDLYAFSRTDKFVLKGYLVDGVLHQPLPLQKLYIQDDNGQTIDSVTSNNDGYFSYNHLPYKSVGLMPSEEDGVELGIRPLDSNTTKDPQTNVLLTTSNGLITDSVGLDQPKVITYVIESYEGGKNKCAVYENGDKAVYVTFDIRDENGDLIDQYTTDENGCFRLEKLYDGDHYLAISDDLATELEMRFIDGSKEKDADWLAGNEEIRITTSERCVEYEDGTKAISIKFAVKDSSGNTVDIITTDGEGCFQLRKLYNQNTYLELMEDELTELGMRLLPPHDDKDFEWYKRKDKIILKFAKRCLVYKAGGYPSGAKYVIKDKDGNIVDGSITDEEGCLNVKKLYANDSYTVYVLDEEGLTYKAKLDKERYGYLILEQMEMNVDDFEYITITIKRCVEYEDGTKAVQINFAVVDESDLSVDQFVTDTDGCFTVKKLYNDSHLDLMEEELVVLGLRFKDPNAADNWYGSAEKIVLIMAKKCFTYEDGTKAIHAKYLIKDKDGNIVESSVTDEDGCLNLKKLYADGDYYVELIDDAGMTIKYPLKEELSPASSLVLDNIYFEFGKHDLNASSKDVLKDLAIKLNQNPGLNVHVKAHTDARGSDDLNLSLSEKRAKSVADYLISEGVNKSRFTTKGYGETQLVNKCSDGTKCSNKEHAKNRRIEFEFSWK